MSLRISAVFDARLDELDVATSHTSSGLYSIGSSQTSYESGYNTQHQLAFLFYFPNMYFKIK